MSTDNLLHQSSVREMIESPLAAIALTGRIDEREIARMTGGGGFHVARTEETLLDRNRDFLGESNTDEAARRQCVAIADELHRVRSGDDLSLLVTLEKRQGGMIDHVGSRPFPPEGMPPSCCALRPLRSPNCGARALRSLKLSRFGGSPSRSTPTPP